MTAVEFLIYSTYFFNQETGFFPEGQYSRRADRQFIDAHAQECLRQRKVCTEFPADADPDSFLMAVGNGLSDKAKHGR